MQRVKLVGEIAKFGSSWETNCANIADIFKLIDCQTPGFRQHLVEGAEAGVGYTIKRGEDYLEEGEELLLSLNDEDIIIKSTNIVTIMLAKKVGEKDYKTFIKKTNNN